MASETFIVAMTDFIDELVKAFPDEACSNDIIQYKSGLEKQKEQPNCAKNVMTNFHNSVKDKANLITSKDPKFFDNDLIVDLPLKEIWRSPNITEETKDAIWRHLNNLYLLSSMISSVPPNMMNAIEQLAHQCASEMSSGTKDGNAIDSLNGMPDIGSLFSGLQNIMGSQMQQPIVPTPSRPTSANQKKKRNKK